MLSKVDANGNWRSFRHRNYRILYPANALSNIGSWAQRVAQDWLVLQLTDNSGTALGLITAIQFAPTLLLSMHGGLLADKVDKRKLLIATNILAGLSSLTLGLLVVTDLVKLWHVMACATVLGIANALDAPIRQAFTSEIVGQSDVANAVSLNSANFNAGRLVGPAVSGFLIARFDTGPSFLINGSTYFFVIVALLAMRPSEFFIQKKEKTAGTIREALSYVRTHSDHAIRGRVMGIYLTIFMGGTPFGSPLIGWLMENIGVRQTVFLCGFIALAAVAITYVIFKDKVDRPDDLRVSSVLSVDADYGDKTN